MKVVRAVEKLEAGHGAMEKAARSISLRRADDPRAPTASVRTTRVVGKLLFLNSTGCHDRHSIRRTKPTRLPQTQD